MARSPRGARSSTVGLVLVSVVSLSLLPVHALPLATPAANGRPTTFPLVISPLCAPGMGCRCGQPLKLPAFMNPPDPAKAVKLTDAATGIWMPSSLRFDALQQALSLVGMGLQQERVMNMNIKVSVTGLYMDLTALQPFWQAKTAAQLAADQSGFYNKLLDAPVSKAAVMTMNVGASVKMFRNSLVKSLGARLDGSVDVNAKVDQLLAHYQGGKRITKGTRTLLMWKQPADLLVSFIPGDVEGFGQQSVDNAPMRNEPKLLRALFAGYLDENPVSQSLKQSIADTMATMK